MILLAAVLSVLAVAIYADHWETPVNIQLFNKGFFDTRPTNESGFGMPFFMSPEQAACRIANGM